MFQVVAVGKLRKLWPTLEHAGGFVVVGNSSSIRSFNLLDFFRQYNRYQIWNKVNCQLSGIPHKTNL